MKEVIGRIIVIIGILLIVIFIKDETRRSFISTVKKLYKRLRKKDKLKDDINRLKELNTNELINIKYNYIKEAKISNNAKSVIKNLSVIITILISLVGVTIPVTMQFSDNAARILDNALSQKIEIIKQKEITGNEKAEEMKLECNKLYNGESNQIFIVGETFTKVIIIAFSIAIVCIVFVGIILIAAISSYKNSSHYEVLVQYIDNELIKDNVS